MASVYSRQLSWIAEQTRIPETPTEGARVPFIASRIGSCHLGFYRTGNIYIYMYIYIYHLCGVLGLSIHSI